MAPHRALSFPLSCAEEAARASPFKVHKADAAKLGNCDAFRIIRKLLANQQDCSFCAAHRQIDSYDRENWLLQRDITHALIFPVLELYRHASNVAKTMLGDRNIFDLELVFRGEARGAFAWLQCFIAEEEDWCLTRGCPACIVSKVLEAEPTIRIILVACRLSQSLRQPHTSSTELPMFDFWLSSLRNALREDPFWGPDFGDHLERRATLLENGLNELVSQCFELEALASKHSSMANPGRQGKAHAYAPVKPTNLRSSKLPGKEKLVAATAEESWMQQIVLGCWTTLLADTATAKARRKGALEVENRVVEIGRLRCVTG